MWRRLAGPLALALAAGIWGGTYVFSGWLLGGGWFTPFGLLFLRLIITFLVLLPFLPQRRLARPEWPAALALGGVGFLLSLGAQFVGTAWAGSANGSLITATSPAFILLFAALLLGERLGRPRLLAIGLATLGVALVVGTGELFEGDGRAFWGKLMLAGAGLTWGLYTVLAKRFSTRHGALATTAWACLAGALWNLPVVLWQGADGGLWSGIGAPVATWTPLVWLGLGYIAIVSTVIAFFLWNWGFAQMDAGKGAVYFFLQPVVGSVLGWSLLGEQLGLGFFLGGGLILAGVLLAER
jgi:drug/metabolite transporter (DMT)-like permease